MKGVLFHQDNAPAHTSVFGMGAVRDCRFEVVDYPSYSPVSDFLLFPNMKKTTWKAISGKAVSDRWCGHICNWGLLRIRMRASIPHESKSGNTNGRSVYDRRGDYDLLKNKQHFGQIWPLHRSQPMNFSAHPRKPSPHCGNVIKRVPMLILDFATQKQTLSATKQNKERCHGLKAIPMFLNCFQALNKSVCLRWTYHLLSTRRLLTLVNDVPLRSRRALCCTKLIMAITSCWFSTEHGYTALMPFWFSAEDIIWEQTRC